MNHKNAFLGVLFFVLTVLLAINHPPPDINSVSAQLNTNNTTISLGPPLLNEHYKIISKKVATINGTEVREVVFSGNGNVKGINITSIGKAFIIPRPGKVTFIGGKAALMANDSGGASYKFQAIGNYGVAFFDANATGSLSFLNNTIGIYKVQMNKGGDSVFSMWKWGG